MESRRRGGRDGRLDYSAVARIAIEDISVNAPRLTILAAALVASQSRFDTDGRLIGAGIGIGRERVGLEHNARVEVNHALGPETESLLTDGHVPGKSAIEVFGHGFRDACIDTLAQRLADVDVLARDAKWHIALR